MADLQVLKALLPDNPLCGINTYKDTLNLATGDCTRKIRKLVLDGSEDWSKSRNDDTAFFKLQLSDYKPQTVAFCSHFEYVNVTQSGTTLGFYIVLSSGMIRIRPENVATTSLESFLSFLSTQYSNGTPVTVWYVLTTPTTETITVPSVLSGTEEGYLIQDGTPTPSNPIYPTANEVFIWQHSLRKFTTATDTFTALPVDVYADGNNATVALKGNTVQNGTPTPSNPVDVNGVGVRTENLFDVADVILGYHINNSGEIESKSNRMCTAHNIDLTGISEITLSFQTSLTQGVSAIFALYSAGVLVSRMAIVHAGDTIDVSNGDSCLIAFYSSASIEVNTQNTTNIMLNVGSTAKPYEPYGYKIPISSAGQTTPVYLGEVESTRPIKKLVLTGEESWGLWSSGYSDVERYYYKWGKTTPSDYGLICTHFPFNTSNGNFEHIRLGGSNREDFIIFISKTIAPTLADYKSYLAQQYAAGTPVTVWCALRDEETGIVNEPLMKIGDYADTVSSITIPTITGKDTFDVETTLKPSEASISYTGWHDASVKEKSENLFDTTWEQNGIDNAGNPTTSSKRVRAYVDVEPNTEYTFSSNEYIRLIYGYSGTTKIGSICDVPFNATKSYTFTTGATVNRLGIVLMNSGYSQDATDIVPTDVQESMLNTGSTAKPYEPYWK